MRVEFQLVENAGKAFLESQAKNGVKPGKVWDRGVEVCGVCPQVLDCWSKFSYRDSSSLPGKVNEVVVVVGNNINSEGCTLRTEGC